MVTTASDASDTPFGAPPRPLTEDVLQSAQEAVLLNPTPATTMHDEEAVTDARAPGGKQTRGRLARLVGHKPVEAALIAMLAGGLLTASIQLALRRRRR